MTDIGPIAAVLAHPDEDWPRLIYADWLDENAGQVECPACKGAGNFRGSLGPCGRCGFEGTIPDGRCDRAEFIRVQCELAGIPSDIALDPESERDRAIHRRGEALRHRERELLAAHSVDWGWLPIQGPFTVGFGRGFINSVVLSAELWLAHGDQITACEPVEEVRLTTWPRFPDDVPWPDEYAQDTLRQRWPRVKTWVLPPQEPFLFDEITRRSLAGESPVALDRRFFIPYIT